MSYLDPDMTLKMTLKMGFFKDSTKREPRIKQKVLVVEKDTDDLWFKP